MARHLRVACIVATFALLVPGRTTRADDQAVTITEDARYYTLSNGYLTAQVDKASGDLTSVKLQGVGRESGLELMGHGSGHAAGYWEQTPRNAPRHVDRVTIDPKANGGERGEVSVAGYSDGTALGGDGQPGGAMLCDLELRYCLGRGEHGIYAYASFVHPTSYGRTSIGESRFGAKLNGAVFDWLSIDADRNRKMASGYDWDHGVELNMKEARRLTTGIYTGQAEHKYDYSAVQFNIPAFGWSSTQEHVGLYFINPTIEFLSGGATKVELTGHLDDNTGGDPTLLDYWRGSHYGSTVCNIDAGEQWSKVVGPILIAVNTGPTPDAMFADALAQAKKEAAAWPYDWVEGLNYPHKAERATVSGQLILTDPQARTTDLPNLLVGLAYPDTLPAPAGARGGRGGAMRMDWQTDSKHYQFWVRGDEQGRFSIPNVRPGNYELHAIADGVLGEFSVRDVIVTAGQSLDMGKLDWKPIRYGRQLWDIGIPNRTAAEFFRGDQYFHWGNYLLYARDFPNDVNYVIGTSDFRKDWNYEQVPHALDLADNTGKGNGRATTWVINFDLGNAPHGRATLRLALCGVDARSLAITVNDQPAGVLNNLFNNGAVHRDSVQGYWAEYDQAFDASLMHAGRNVMKLTVPAGSVTNGIMYDYLRLELEENGVTTRPGGA